MEFGKYVLTIGALLAVGIMYEKFKKTYVEDEEIQNYEKVRQYLVTDSSLARSRKPILWIHLSYDTNARWWQSFYSRNTTDLNQPYLLLTIKSIIDKCGSCFNVCIVDDDSFCNIIPGWSLDMTRCAEPIRSKVRKLAMTRLLKHYGGLVVPPSFLCMKNLADMYYLETSKGKPVVGEFIDHTQSSVNRSYIASDCLIGAQKDCPLLDDYISFLQREISTDYTAESVFTGADQTWWQSKVDCGDALMIPAEMLGQADTEEKMVSIDRLMGNTYVDLVPTALGVYLPAPELLKRTAYNWFARMSACQALESDTIAGKLLLTTR
jgi:hypothetical protein